MGFELSNLIRIRKLDEALTDFSSLAAHRELDGVIPIVDENTSRVIENINVYSVPPRQQGIVRQTRSNGLVAADVVKVKADAVIAHHGDQWSGLVLEGKANIRAQHFFVAVQFQFDSKGVARFRVVDGLGMRVH